MDKKCEVIIFDVDGTLINPEEGVCRAVNYVIKKYNLTPIPNKDLLAFNGPPIHKSFLKHYRLSKSEIDKLVETFRTRYKDNDLFYAYVYEGIYQLFESLVYDGYRIGIATYKRQDYATKLMQHFQFDKYAEVICGSDVDNKLTKKDIIANCLAELKVEDYSQVIMVGDSDNDAIAAKNLNIHFLGVTYGFGFEKEEDMVEYQPIGCAHAPQDVYCIIKEF